MDSALNSDGQACLCVSVVVLKPAHSHGFHSLFFLGVLSPVETCQVLFILLKMALADKVQWGAPKLSVLGEATSQKVLCPFIGQDLLKRPASDNSIENPLLGLFSLQLQ